MYIAPLSLCSKLVSTSTPACTGVEDSGEYNITQKRVKSQIEKEFTSM